MSRCVAVTVGALMLAGIVPLAAPAPAMAGAEPYAVETGTIYAPTPVSGEHVGTAVATSGRTIAVGVPGYDTVTGMTDRGIVHVYTHNGAAWVLQQSLVPSDGAAGDQFGYDVDIYANTIVVGAPFCDTGQGPNVGAVYVFTRTASVWSQRAKLTVVSDADYHLGMSVAIDYATSQGESTIAAGMPGYSSKRGKVEIWSGDGATWTLDAEVTDSPGAVEDELGLMLDVNADRGLVLASSGGVDYGGLTNCGAVLSFYRGATGWVRQQYIRSPNPGTNEYFGGPIAISRSGYTALIGNQWEYQDATYKEVGAAYIYRRPVTSWEYGQTIANPEPTAGDGDFFGSGVALDGDRHALIGAFWDDSHSGAAYFYDVNQSGSFVLSQKITATGEWYGGSFGDDVALSAGVAAVGAPNASKQTPSVIDCGAVGVFDTYATIRGTCRNAVTGVPLSDVQVSIEYADASGDPEPEIYWMSFTDGTYQVQVPSGRYRIGHIGPSTAYRAGWYNKVNSWTDATWVQFWAGTTTTIDLDIYPLAQLMPVYRFFNKLTSTHLYTADAAEAAHIRATWPTTMRDEGIAYNVDLTKDTTPLHRLFNLQTGTHFYTADPNELAYIRATWPTIFRYEGPTYPVTAGPWPGKTAVYRFFNLQTGTHFYTASEVEKDYVRATWPTVMRFEGPAYWVGP